MTVPMGICGGRYNQCQMQTGSVDEKNLMTNRDQKPNQSSAVSFPLASWIPQEKQLDASPRTSVLVLSAE